MKMYHTYLTFKYSNFFKFKFNFKQLQYIFI